MTSAVSAMMSYRRLASFCGKFFVLDLSSTYPPSPHCIAMEDDLEDDVCRHWVGMATEPEAEMRPADWGSVSCKLEVGRYRYLKSVSVFGIFKSRYGIRYRYCKIPRYRYF
jgi:hypothetical protein